MEVQGRTRAGIGYRLSTSSQIMKTPISHLYGALQVGPSCATETALIFPWYRRRGTFRVHARRHFSSPGPFQPPYDIFILAKLALMYQTQTMLSRSPYGCTRTYYFYPRTSQACYREMIYQILRRHTRILVQNLGMWYSF